MDTQSAVPETENEMHDFTLNLEGIPTKKPVRKWIIIVAIVAALLIIAAVVTAVIILNRDNADDEKVITIIDVERQANNSDSLGGMWNNEPFARDISVDLDINDLALAVLEKEIPELEFLNDLDGLSVDTSIAQNNGMIRLSLSFDYDGESVPPIDITVDSETKCMYISSELFSDNYLKFDLVSMLDEELKLDLEEVFGDNAVDPEIHARYFDEFLELMFAQETETKKLTASGVSQECTVYSAKIDIKEAAQLLIDYLSELKTKNSMLNEFAEPIIEAVEKGLEDAEKLDSVYWYVYTDDAGKIIGREITYLDEQILYYLYTIDGEDVGFDFNLSGLEISGNGIYEDDLLDATFIVSEEDVDYIKISTEDFDVNGIQTGTLNGSIVVKPTDALMEDYFGVEVPIPVSLSIDFENKDSKQDIEISIMEIITLSISTFGYEPDVIVLPEGNAIDGSDPDALSKLFDIFDSGDSV